MLAPVPGSKELIKARAVGGIDAEMAAAAPLAP
jgi:hypothetical protein